MTKNRKIMVTLGIMLSLFMSSMEATVVSTAMPTIVGQLGGLEHYSWIFSAFMLASTSMVPLYGKLSDLYGRARLYLAAMLLFLVGSALCGHASSMTDLIIFRAIQGLGAGGVQPMVFIMIGEMFTLQQRARMQGLFSGVWGFSSIVGPLLGGFLVDQISWQWVFWINLGPGLLAAGMVWIAWRDLPRTAERIVVDFGGAALLTAGVVALLLGLMESLWPLIALSVLLFGLLMQVERRAADPIIPLQLFRQRLFSTAMGHGFLSGAALFGSASFVPLFVQAVLGTSATQAGLTLTPQLFCWFLAAMLGARIMIRVGYRILGLIGMTLLSLGTLLLSQIGVDSNQASLMVYTGLMGTGMGLSVPTFLIAVQSTVARQSLGIATSAVQFARTIGGTIGVSVFGYILTSQLSARLAALGLDPNAAEGLLNSTGGPIAANAAVRLALSDSISSIYFAALVVALLALFVVFLAPQVQLDQNPGESPEQPSSV